MEDKMEKFKPELRQQGDILFYKLPDDTEVQGPPVNNGLIAEGEHTGHMHVLVPLKQADSQTALVEPKRHRHIRVQERGYRPASVTTKVREIYGNRVNNIDQVIEAYEDAHVTHQEHATITLPTGKWAIGRVVEEDYASGQMREIAD